ncbi:hypothetical protein E2562_027632 [Oryza meyeriana var. granulata]|uniref:JmjC domain-containing protein n=1 Tax=Oryza meyeriana var. granulata TaxID=110450 RepID=A0A6G1E362_9ORYZ|nr:hypothetical protein E2562_027632 [Oryza meyeriana var. granulata]
MDRTAGGSGIGGRVKVVGHVERVDARRLCYAEFVDRFMRPNRPVVLTGLTSSWRSCQDWTLAADRRAPDLEFLARTFPSPFVQVADCSSWEFSDQKRLEMSMREFVDHWVGSSSNGNSGGSLLYLKDWHFVKELGLLFMLMFLGPTAGRQMNLRSSVYNINDDVSEKQFPEFNNAEWLECTQEQNEIIFVPSGWYHQVHNLEDTISINHNWFNGYNLHWVWNLLHEDYKVAKDYIEDIRDICDDFEGLCQRNLAANTGMNFYDFFVFITRP